MKKNNSTLRNVLIIIILFVIGAITYYYNYKRPVITREHYGRLNKADESRTVKVITKVARQKKSPKDSRKKWIKRSVLEIEIKTKELILRSKECLSDLGNDDSLEEINNFANDFSIAEDKITGIFKIIKRNETYSLYTKLEEVFSIFINNEEDSTKTAFNETVMIKQKLDMLDICRPDIDTLIDKYLFAHEEYKWGNKSKEMIQQTILEMENGDFDSVSYPQSVLYQLNLLGKLSKANIINKSFEEELELLATRVMDHIKYFEFSFREENSVNDNREALKDYFETNNENLEETKLLIKRIKVSIKNNES